MKMINLLSKKWRAFIGICLLSFGCYLDYTVVNVALPTIQEELGASITSLQWVMNINFLVICILATIMGRVGDLYGRRKLFYLGAFVFAVSSVLAGLSKNINWLILWRFWQGVAGAMILPLGPSILPSVFSTKESQKAISWLGSLGGLALALGPVLGGLIVTYWGWRWIFFINIPLTILGFIFCIGAIPETVSAGKKASMDWPGMIVLTLALGGLVLGLIQTGTTGWLNTWTLTFWIVGIVASFILVYIENRKENPLIDFKDFGHLLFYSGAVLSILSGMMSAAVLFFDPLYLQVIQGFSVQWSGIILFIIPLVLLVVALAISALIHRLGIINTILVGLAAGSFAALLQAFFTPETGLWFMVLSFIALGTMWAMGNTVSIIAAQTSAGPERVSVATGTIVTIFNMGGSLGLAMTVTLFHFFSLSRLPGDMRTNQLIELLKNPSQVLKIKLDSMLQNLFNTGFMHGFNAAMWFLFAIAVAGFLSILVLGVSGVLRKNA
jgi:EmrB/QacA subfamily drug resistance transporter